MREVIFTLSLLALCVYAAALCYASAAYWTVKNRLALKFTALAAIFILENSVIYVYSYIASVFGYASEVIYLFYFFINCVYTALIRLVVKDIADAPVGSWEIALYAAYVILQVVLLVLQKIALFFLASAVMFLLIAGATLLWTLIHRNRSRWLLALLICSLVLGALVIVEDMFLPRYVASAYEMSPHSYINSLSLNLLAMVHCGFMIVYSHRLLAEKASAAAPPSPSDQVEQLAKTYGLTNREKDIILLLLADKTNQEIADALYISIGTVKSHTHNIYTKCGVSSKKGLRGLCE